MKRMIHMMVFSAFVMALCLPADVAALNAVRSPGDMEAYVTLQKAEPIPPDVFYCPQKEGTKTACPVDKKFFTIMKDTPNSDFPCCGVVLYFCSEACKTEFITNNPTKNYLGDALKTPPKAFDCPRKEGHRATCPVMGNAFTITKDTLHTEIKGKFVYFCCPGCKPGFDNDPKKYLGEI